MQEKAEGTTVKKFLDETRERLANTKVHIQQGDLQAMKEKLQKTHSALVSTSYMWANEGLFGSGFYHGDLHAGNLMVDGDGKITMIDFGNATQLDYKIEVPGAVHNFLESQKRLAAAMDETTSLLGAINEKLGVNDEPKPLSMMQCLVQVVKNNISINLLKGIGLRNVGNVMNTIQQDPLLKNNAPANQVIINP